MYSKAVRKSSGSVGTHKPRIILRPHSRQPLFLVLSYPAILTCEQCLRKSHNPGESVQTKDHKQRQITPGSKKKEGKCPPIAPSIMQSRRCNALLAPPCLLLVFSFGLFPSFLPFFTHYSTHFGERAVCASLNWLGDRAWASEGWARRQYHWDVRILWWFMMMK